MPAFVLGTGLAAVLMRQTRNSMIEVLSADYVRTARAKGLAQPAVVIRHALRNGLIPVVTILGLQMGALMGGAVVTEQIFVLPGFGRLIVEAVFTRDYPVVQGVVLITAASYVLINFLVDVSYTLLNPRIRIRGPPMAPEAAGPGRLAAPADAVVDVVAARDGSGGSGASAAGGRPLWPARWSSCSSQSWRWARRGSSPTTLPGPTGARSARHPRGRTRSAPMTLAATRSRA